MIRKTKAKASDFIFVNSEGIKWDYMFYKIAIFIWLMIYSDTHFYQ